MIADAYRVLPDAEKSFAVFTVILADIKQGKMPAVTTADLVLLERDFGDVKKLIADIKAVIA